MLLCASSVLFRRPPGVPGQPSALARLALSYVGSASELHAFARIIINYACWDVSQLSGHDLCR